MKNGRRPLDDQIRQMLALHEMGLTYRQIGERLSVSYETVRTHVRRHTDTEPAPLITDDDGSCWMTTTEASEALGVTRGGVQARIEGSTIESFAGRESGSPSVKSSCGSSLQNVLR